MELETKSEGNNTMTIKEAIDTLKQAMADDPDYAYGWHCNIAMAFQDEGADYEQAQRAASRS
jgi:hypothetical protein